MITKKMMVGVVFAVCVSFTSTACIGLYESIGEEPPIREEVAQVSQPPVVEEVEQVDEPAPEPEQLWSCIYLPTYDDNWHDDVICSNIIETHRPHLRDGDSYITESEMMESAREYEAELNLGLSGE